MHEEHEHEDGIHHDYGTEDFPQVGTSAMYAHRSALEEHCMAEQARFAQRMLQHFRDNPSALHGWVVGYR